MVSLYPRAPRTSEVLHGIAHGGTGERVPFGELVAAMRNRAFGVLFLLLGLPNCLPMPPGVPMLLGIMLALIAAQMLIGRDELWLPGWLARKGLARRDLQRVVRRSEPWIQRLERLARPRYHLMSSAPARRVVGAVGVVLGLALLLPIPLIGNIPLGIPICILGLGLIERDGLVILAGYVATVLGIGVMAGLGWLLWQGAVAVL